MIVSKFMTLPRSPDEFRTPPEEIINYDDEAGWGCHALTPNFKAKMQQMTKQQLSQELKTLQAIFKVRINCSGAKDALLQRLTQHFRVHPEHIPDAGKDDMVDRKSMNKSVDDLEELVSTGDDVDDNAMRHLFGEHGHTLIDSTSASLLGNRLAAVLAQRATLAEAGPT